MTDASSREHQKAPDLLGGDLPQAYLSQRRLSKTAGNRVIHDAVMRSRHSIVGGETISEPLKASGVFPPMVTQMINVGEQTGSIDQMLDKIADFYDDEVDTAVDALLSAMEPVMIVFLGAIVGGMIVAMYLPIFDMIETVGG